MKALVVLWRNVAWMRSRRRCKVGPLPTTLRMLMRCWRGGCVMAGGNLANRGQFTGQSEWSSVVEADASLGIRLRFRLQRRSSGRGCSRTSSCSEEIHPSGRRTAVRRSPIRWDAVAGPTPAERRASRVLPGGVDHERPSLREWVVPPRTHWYRRPLHSPPARAGVLACQWRPYFDPRRTSRGPPGASPG